MKTMKINTNRNKTYINCVNRNEIKLYIKLKLSWGSRMCNAYQNIDIGNLFVLIK